MLSGGHKNVRLCVCLIFVSAILLASAIVVYFKYFASFVDKGLLVPIVICTWDYQTANDKAWEVIIRRGHAVSAVESGISACEAEQCRHTVGFGGSPDERGETTLDALIIDGTTMNVGAVGALREIKSAISVARHVLNNTQHSLLVGSQATEFAVNMGFHVESLSTNYSTELHRGWKDNKCQPNYWQNVAPDPKTSCGPYHPKTMSLPIVKSSYTSETRLKVNDENHDTIGMISVDHKGNVAAGTSTNGLSHKIPGRVGDSPIPGAGAFAENGIGAAVATGNGDIMMRFAPTAIAVEYLRNGHSAQSAAKAGISRIAKYYPDFAGALVVATPYGDFGAACNGWDTFPFTVHARGSNMTVKTIKCE